MQRSTLLLSLLGTTAIASASFMTWHATRAPAAQTLAAASAGEACEPGSGCAAPTKAVFKPVERPTGKPRLLAFSSQHCAACSKMEPVFSSAVKACAASSDVMKVDVDQDDGADLAASYRIASVPTWISVDASGAEIARLSGVLPEQRIEAALEEIRGTRCNAKAL